MAYVPSLNDGRINATIAGNTAGIGALVSTGTMTLVGGNNITLSQNGNAITISAPNTPTGSINFSASNTSANLASVAFSNSNGVSFGLTNGTITASHNGITSQSVQTVGVYATGANTIGQSSSSTFDGRSLNISGQGALSAGWSGSTLQVSAPAVSSVNAAGIVNISSNGSSVTISAPAFSAGIASNSTVTNRIILTAGNNITLSQSTNAAGATVTVSAGVASINVSASNTSANLASVAFSNSNGVSFGLTNGTITASHNGLTSQSSQALSGANGSFTFQTASFANSNGISFSTGTQGLYASHNGITSQSNQIMSMFALGNTVLTSTGTPSASSLAVSGAGNVSVGYSNGTLRISGGAGGTLNLNTVNKTSDYTVTTSDAMIFVDATSGNVAITLPAASGASGYQFTIKRIDGSANTVTVACTGGNTIDGSATYTLDVQYMALSVASNGTVWYIV